MHLPEAPRYVSIPADYQRPNTSNLVNGGIILRHYLYVHFNDAMNGPT